MNSRPGAAADIAQILRGLCRGTGAPRDTDRLITLATAIVKRRMHGRLAAAAKVEGTTVEQAATSIVAGLVAPAGPECALGHAGRSLHARHPSAGAGARRSASLSPAAWGPGMSVDWGPALNSPFAILAS